jgi:hypothetical protein
MKLVPSNPIHRLSELELISQTEQTRNWGNTLAAIYDSLHESNGVINRQRRTRTQAENALHKAVLWLAKDLVALGDKPPASVLKERQRVARWRKTFQEGRKRDLRHWRIGQLKYKIECALLEQTNQPK